MKKGFTLVELLVSMVIFSIVMAAIIMVYLNQHRKTVQVRNISALQTDAQVAFELLKWDLKMAGFGVPEGEKVIEAFDGGRDSADRIIIYGVALGLELANARWNLIKRSTGGVATDEIQTNYWTDDTTRNIKRGDYIVAIDPESKTILSSFLGAVVDTAYFSATDSLYHIRIDRNVNFMEGLILLGVESLSPLTQGIEYRLDNNGVLWRGNDVFLENVEDIQFAYGIDGVNGTDPDNEIDPDEWVNDLSSVSQEDLFNRKFAIRVTLIVKSKGTPGFNYGRDQIISENRIINLTSRDKRQDRMILQAVVYPRNLNLY